MGVYALRGAGKDADALAKGSRFVLSSASFILHWFLWVIRPLEQLMLRMGLGPGGLNFLGLGLGLLSAGLVATGNLDAGGWSMAASGLCDVLDGRIARATKQASPYGKFIDSTLDRFVEVFVLLGFVFLLRRSPWGAFLGAAALGGSVLVSYAQARAETVGVSGTGGLMQRAERLVLLCLACLLDGAAAKAWGIEPGGVLTVALGLIAVASLLTAIHRTVSVSRRLLGS
jgi:phosphatidylglycerophosphate synthase